MAALKRVDKHRGRGGFIAVLGRQKSHTKAVQGISGLSVYRLGALGVVLGKTGAEEVRHGDVQSVKPDDILFTGVPVIMPLP